MERASSGGVSAAQLPKVRSFLIARETKDITDLKIARTLFRPVYFVVIGTVAPSILNVFMSQINKNKTIK